ncbi:MAG: hypothetical protein AB1430_19585 [Pseudomonadota bacterium]
MTEELVQQPWIQRCAQRIQWRHMVAPAEALELAAALHNATGGGACPERAADELFVEQQDSR